KLEAGKLLDRLDPVDSDVEVADGIPSEETLYFAQTPEGLLQKPVESEFVVVGRQHGRVGSGPDGFDVLHDDDRPAGRPVAVEKDGDLLVHRIRSQKQFAHLPQLILRQLILHSLEAQRYPDPHHGPDRPANDELHFRHHFSGSSCCLFELCCDTAKSDFVFNGGK
ncbi:hypothetical protein BHE74_00033141, partial [Ensete ventricosum]